MNVARQTYNRLWREAIPRLGRGEPQTDPHLSNWAGDGRRGVTLVFRPEPAVRERVDLFVRQLAEVAPGQYCYQPAELHVTVLSVIPGSEKWREKIHDLAAIHAVIGKVLKRQRSFDIAFHGITASPGAVMLQGFPQSGALAEIRDDLRHVLRRNCLGGDVDRRYKINTAHITVMRFGHALADWTAFADLLRANRQTDFGEMRVTKLQLIWGDWYASARSVRTIQEYPLADPSGRFT